jgi:Ca-activated chloride channel family protein
VLASLAIPAVTGALTRVSPEELAKMRREMEAGEMLAQRRRGAEDADENLTRSHEVAKEDVSAKIAAVAAAPTAETLDFRESDLLAAAPADRVDKGQVTAAPSASSAAPMAMSRRDAVAIAGTVTGWRMERAVGSGTGIRQRQFNTEAYDSISENGYHAVGDEPLSTFSIDVDTASYANVRRFLTDGQRPPAGAVRIEELINYFPYAYPQPEGGVPFSVTTDVTKAPWNPSLLLARVGLQGREIAKEALPPTNLVFLIDVSGSMNSEAKLPLLKRSLVRLVDELREGDRVAIVTYAGASGLALESTDAADKAAIREAIEGLGAGGATNGASGIRLAYDTAREHFLKEGNNRVVLCTDGDFNVGTTSRSELVDLIEEKRESGVFLSVLSFGTGNLKDSAMEQLADKGNGNYAYIDSAMEGEKVLVEQMGGTLFTIAKDVKIQVEFNPANVAGYRLIGYENRVLAKEDFNDDTKDAGEIGAGHSVTALYEIVPVGGTVPGVASVDALKYQLPETRDWQSPHNDLFTVKLRYKEPDGEVSKLIERVVGPEVVGFDEAPEDLRFAAAVAAYGMKLRGSEHAGDLGWTDVQRIARGAMGADPGSYRAEFLTLVERAERVETEE